MIMIILVVLALWLGSNALAVALVVGYVKSLQRD